MVIAKKLLFSALCLLAPPMQAVFFMGERFINRHGNTIECFGDIHISCDASQVIETQQQQIIDFAGAGDSCVIVEDMNARFDEIKEATGWHIDTVFDTPLDNLSTNCNDACINCCNVEFRHKSAMSFAGFPVTGCQAVHSFNTMVDEIANYNDGTILNAYYWRTLSTVLSTHKALISGLQQVDCSLKDYCEDMCPRKKEKINLYDVSLLDARILHQIYENRFKSKIFVCAGVNHIKRIKPMLHKLGYKSLGAIEKNVVIDSDNLIHSSSALSVADYFDHYDNVHPYFNATPYLELRKINNSSMIC